MTVTDAHVSGGIEIGGSAPASFVHGSGPALSDVVFEWDFDNDGDFDPDAVVVASYPAPALEPDGLTHDGTNLWVSCEDTQTIYRLDPDDGSVVDSFPNPANAVTGLAHDGTNLWAVSPTTDTIYRLNPAGGAVLGSFASPGTAPEGLAWDGTSLWNADRVTDTIYRLNPAGGAVLASIPTPSLSPRGLEWIDGYLWVADGPSTATTIYKVDPDDGTILARTPAPSTNAEGLAWDGTNLWNCDFVTGLIYRLVFNDVEDITRFVVTGETQTGRDYPSALTGEASPGQLKLTVLNFDDRFSIYNTSSPLNQAPNSLRTGRKIRVRTASSTPTDPVLLARDRFNRPDGPLGTTETGQPWTNQQGSFRVTGEVAVAHPDVFLTGQVATVDVGEEDHYAQATLRQIEPDDFRFIGLMVRWDDADNFAAVYYNCHPTNHRVGIVERDGGIETELDSYSVRGWEGMTIGAGVVGQTITAYVAGVPVASATLAGAPTTEVGMFANYQQFRGRPPEVDDFYVWDHVASEDEGVLWTGEVSKVESSVALGPEKFVEVTGEGVLVKAARADIASPRLPVEGAPTGLIVGDILSHAYLLHPPAVIAEGTITTGPVGIDDGDALSLAREVEETERGFLYETNEGYIGYDGRDARATAVTQAWFSDAPGSQFGYREIVPGDERAQIVNRVTAGVAPDAPSLPAPQFVTGNEVPGVQITVPTVAQGDLLVVFIASSIQVSSTPWLVPIWWVEHRDLKAAAGMRVYSHWCDGSESGTTVLFYDPPGAQIGLWAALIYRIPNWFQSYNNGVAMGDPVRGGNPQALVHGWGREPTLFIVVRTGIGSGDGIDLTTDINPPDGYDAVSGIVNSSGVTAFDVGLITALKIDCTESEDPTEIFGLGNATIDESVVFAVRGFNGPHTKATLENPQTTGGAGRSVTVNDVESQDEHNLIRSHTKTPVLFATESDAEAYTATILATHADDRPILTISFVANKTAAYRAQAIRRRVGDKIHLTADHTTGLGIDADFFIESINNRFTKGGTLWEVTWELSPA